ncbi:TPA: hypothetical protein ACJJCL_002103, partial [Neisseria meningitidis]
CAGMTGFEVSVRVIPTKVGIQFFEFQSFPINCLSIECLDSRLRGNDGRAVSVAPDKCRNLKSRHSLKNKKPKSET